MGYHRKPRLISARSKERFPSLTGKGSCPWHADCTPMDCEFFRIVPSNTEILANVLKGNGKRERRKK